MIPHGGRPDGNRSTVQRTDPIFIHGILPRSGTNFLWDLLLLHPDCAPAVDPVREDLFLDHSDHLLAFSEAVQGAWDPRWGRFSRELPGRLHAALGEGLVSFLWEDRARRLVSKSPSVRHLERFFEFFPSARLLILIRDGRSVTQSCVDTFGWEFERAARAWADGADEVARFRDSQAHRADRWRVVHYEALLDDLDGQMPVLLNFAGLDPSAYDLQAARNLPVRGSSAFGRNASSVSWEPVEKNAGFSPKERWRSWTPPQHERFAWIAGEQMRALGYDVGPVGPKPGRTARHRLADLAWAGRRTAHLLRVRIGVATGPLRRRLGESRGGS